MPFLGTPLTNCLFTYPFTLMKTLQNSRLSIYVILATLMVSLTSCEAIKGIFKAGVWSGIIMVVLGVALVIWVVSKLFGGGR